MAIPVFPSRVFRHGYFFINTKKGISSPADLKGKRGGVPEYSMTAAVYMRGLLQHEYGIKPSDIEWVQGRADRLGHALSDDIRLTQAPDGSELGDLLEHGEIDFLMTANNPLSFRRGAPTVRDECRRNGNRRHGEQVSLYLRKNSREAVRENREPTK